MHEVEQGFSQGLDTEETAALVKSLVAADDTILAEVYMEAILHACHDMGRGGQRGGPCVPHVPAVKKDIVVVVYGWVLSPKDRENIRNSSCCLWMGIVPQRQRKHLLSL